jgi:hypothetical protein
MADAPVVVAPRCPALGESIKTISKPGVGHPHCPEYLTPIVGYILRHLVQPESR